MDGIYSWLTRQMKFVIPATAVLFLWFYVANPMQIPREFSNSDWLPMSVACLILSLFVWAVLMVVVGILLGVLGLFAGEWTKGKNPERAKPDQLSESEKFIRFCQMQHDWEEANASPLPLTFHNLIFGETRAEILESMPGFKFIGEESGILGWEGDIRGEHALIGAEFTPRSGVLWRLRLKIDATSQNAFELLDRFVGALTEKYGKPVADLESAENMLDWRNEEKIRKIRMGQTTPGKRWKVAKGTISCSLTTDLAVLVTYTHLSYFAMANEEEKEEAELKQHALVEDL